MSTHQWSTDGKRFAGLTATDPSTIRVYHTTELFAEIQTDVPSDEQKSILGFSPDAPQLAHSIRDDDHIHIWQIEPEIKRLSTIDLSHYKPRQVIFAADQTLIVQETEHLHFLDALTGEVRASHALFQTPDEDPITVTLKANDLGTFPMTDSWGYFTDNIIIANAPADDHIQLAVDRRHAWPLAWLETHQYPDFYAAVEAHPTAFPKPILKAFKKTASQKALAKKTSNTKGPRLPFPLENEHNLNDLLASTQQWLQEGFIDSLGDTSEIAIQLILWGRADEVETFIGNLEDTRIFTNSDGKQFDFLAQNRRNITSIAQVAAYLSRTDQKELAKNYIHIMEKHLERMTSDNRADRPQICGSDPQAVTKAWIAAAKTELTGTDEGYFDQVWNHYEKDAQKDNWQDRTFRNIATAYAFSGQYDRALDMLIDRADYFHFADIKEFAGLLAESKDIDKIERLSKWFYTKENYEDQDITAWMIDACNKANQPQRAYDFLKYVRGGNSTKQWTTIAQNIAAKDSNAAAEKFLESSYSEHHDEHYAGHILAAWAQFNPQAASAIVNETLANLSEESSDNTYKLEKLAPAIAFIKTPQEALEFFLKLDDDHLITYLAALPPETPSFKETIEKGAAHVKSNWDAMTDYSKIRNLDILPHILKVLRPFPEWSDQVADHILKIADKDELTLRNLAHDFAAAGDLTRANIARMRIKIAKRKNATTELFKGAITAGHFSAALAMLDQMEAIPCQTSIREQYATYALVQMLGDGALRTIIV